MKAAAADAPPFFANTSDGLHCFQATVRGALKYFLPDRNFSWEELDRMSAKLPGKATWPQAMLINLHQMDFDIVVIEAFDGRDFIKRGADYLVDAFGRETADWQTKHSDLAQEQKLYEQAFAAGVTYEQRVPELADLRNYLQRGYLLMCVVNSHQLNGKTGYAGHFVLVYDIDDRNVTLHDPGLPGRQARQVPLAEFEQAWADPNDTAKNLIALKYEGKAYD